MFSPYMQDPGLKKIIFFSKMFFNSFIISSLSTSCNEAKTETIQAKIRERVEDYRQERQAQCRESLLQEAEKIVDSLLLAEATQEIQDSLNRNRPGRPVQPPDVPAIDSSPVLPLFQQPKPASSTRN